MENMKFDYNYNNMKENTRETVEEVQVREFKKSSKLNNVLYDVRGPVVEEAARMENAGTQVLKLNIGNPAPFGFRTPDEVIYDMRQQLTECEGYSPAKGLFSARKAIMQYAQLKKLPNVSIEDIYTGNGVSELINLCMSALLDNGDEILIPSPDYPPADRVSCNIHSAYRYRGLQAKASTDFQKVPSKTWSSQHSDSGHRQTRRKYVRLRPTAA